MQLGVEVSAGRTRLCLASTLLGAGPDSWADFNHRTWEIPNWLLFRLHVGPSGASEIEEVLAGSEAITAAGQPAFGKEMESGQAVVWPWFPRQVERNARTFVEAFQHFWNARLASHLSEDAHCVCANIAGPLVRIGRLGEALDHLKDIVSLQVLPDCYCAWRSVSSRTPASERVIYVDPGHETFRLTRFRIHREDHEEWITIEDYEEIEGLGWLRLLGPSIMDQSMNASASPGLGGWLALEAQIEKMRAEDNEPPLLREARPQMKRAVESFALAAESEGAKVDQVLVRRHLSRSSVLEQEPGYESVERHGVAMGAALFGQEYSESVHFIIPGNLYLSVNGSEPETITRHEEILQTTTAGASFSREILRGSLDEVNLSLLWGIGSGAGAFLPLARMSRLLTSSSHYVVAGITLHRAGWNVYGTLWVGEPEENGLPAERWSLDLGKWSYWTAR